MKQFKGEIINANIKKKIIFMYSTNILHCINAHLKQIKFKISIKKRKLIISLCKCPFGRLDFKGIWNFRSSNEQCSSSIIFFLNLKNNFFSGKFQKTTKIDVQRTDHSAYYMQLSLKCFKGKKVQFFLYLIKWLI